jgi:hypothetical protein
MHQIDPVLHLILQIVITLIAVPMIVWLFQRSVKKADDAKKEKEDERHVHFKEAIDSLLAKVTRFCEKNNDEHNELFTARREQGNRITSIETIHHTRGCDQPYQRRSGE